MNELDKVAAKLLNEIDRPFIISGNRLLLTASIGVALYPDNGETYADLTKSADRAMYFIKHRNKNGYAFLSELPDVYKQSNIFLIN